LVGAVFMLLLFTATATHAQPSESASVSGTVVDVSGGAVANAEVRLMDQGGSIVGTAITRQDGTFAFDAIPAASYVISVTATGFETYGSPTVTLVAGQPFRVPNVVLSIAAVTTSVVVLPTEVIAAQQIKAEEQQRVLGVIPDFYTSYVWNAAPLNAKQKFSLAVRRAFDPVTLVGTSFGAGIEQVTNTFPGYGWGAEGYAKRWGALFVTARTSEMLSRAVFPSIFHQDPRYFYQGSGSTWSRIRHAVGSAFLARSDSGHLMPNYSYVLGAISSGALSNLYYPEASRGAGLVVTNAALGIAGRAGQNLIREFVFRHLTKHVRGDGKPASEQR
jgi:hypothetical protein